MKILDHGEVILVDSMGSDLSIVRSARVSYNAAWRAGEDSGGDIRLLKYLYNNGHNTPFESVVFTFFIQAPIFVFRQWHRHRTQSYNEMSARYTELPEIFYIPESDQITTQSKDNKQMRTNEKNENANDILNIMMHNNQNSFMEYRNLLKMGCPRELARSILPMGTYSKMFATVNLHNLFRFLKERLHEHAQYEIRVYAQGILELIEPVVPEATKIFKESL